MKKKREENVELADIQAVRERMTQWAIRLCLLLIPVIVGIILSTQGESTTRAGNFVVRIAFLLILMGAGYVAYLRNLERKYWAKYQQIHRMDNLPIDDVHKYLAQAGNQGGFGEDDGRGVPAISRCASAVTQSRIPQKNILIRK